MLRRSLLLLPATLALPAQAQGFDPSSAVFAARGTLPLIFTVPHDGENALPRVSVRSSGAVVRDAQTRDLAERTAAALEARTGRRPYIVVALFSRRYLDANRAEQEAMESPEALPAYRAYHDQIASWVAEVKARFPEGALLIDIHGQSSDPDVTFRGTRGGLTAKALLGRSGTAALQGERSIIGLLAARGYRVHPAPGTDDLREDSRFSGGYTVFSYGSHRPEGIDAIQLEFGRYHRTTRRLAADFADALVVFMQEYGLLAR